MRFASVQCRWNAVVRWLLFRVTAVGIGVFFTMNVRLLQSYVRQLQVYTPDYDFLEQQVRTLRSGAVKPRATSSHLVADTREPTHRACEGYDGLLHIHRGDDGGAAGTIFFQFVIAQLIYAERHNLKPWVHFTPYSSVIYDADVHGQGPGVSIRARQGRRSAVDEHFPGGTRQDISPGPPTVVESSEDEVLHFGGTGVWLHYFQPVSDFVPGDRSCENVPYVTLGEFHTTVGVHSHARWAPRCWRYSRQAEYVHQPHKLLSEWRAPHLELGGRKAKAYIRFQPDLVAAGRRVNPHCSWEEPCLALHIRHSDKANQRRVIEVSEFLPYVKAFYHEGGQHVYLATDSKGVLQEIQDTWPAPIRAMLRTIGDDIVRSENTTAVFNIGSHDRTNREILTEMVALAECQYMLHGLSAVTDSVLWMNVDLQRTSVNLELPERMNAGTFGIMMQMVKRGDEPRNWPGPDGIPKASQLPNWWEVTNGSTPDLAPTDGACQGKDGVLLIQSVGNRATAGGAFYIDIVNQLIFAEKNNFVPWIHLGPDADKIYDDVAHGTATTSLPLEADSLNPGSLLSSGAVASSAKVNLVGRGVWESYFAPASNFPPNDASCVGKKLQSLNTSMVTGLSTLPEYVRARTTSVVEPSTSFASMRQRGSEIVERYFHLAPYIEERVDEVNPSIPGTTCMAAHYKFTGRKNSKKTLNEFFNYIKNFLQNGGDFVYLGTDSIQAMENIQEKLPKGMQDKVRTQGQAVVRVSEPFPIDMMDSHHRVNSEVLVDIKAMSRCQVFLHTHSTVAEAVLYTNPSLHNASININDPDRMSRESFVHMVQEVVTMTVGVSTRPDISIEIATTEVFIERMSNATILKFDSSRPCKPHAIVYWAKKGNYDDLQRSLRLLHDNYLSIDGHRDNADIFIFHAAEFDASDLRVLEVELENLEPGTLRLVDLTNSSYWKSPKTTGRTFLHGKVDVSLEEDERRSRFFGMKIWRFLADYSKLKDSSYRYMMHLETGSFIHSRIDYDIFDLMRSEEYLFAFRMCSQQRNTFSTVWESIWRGDPDPKALGKPDHPSCGSYFGLTVADIDFFLSKEVQQFFEEIEHKGDMHRQYTNDVIDSAALRVVANASRIHRFLDFSYENAIFHPTTGCLAQGGIQAGYTDATGISTVGNYYERLLVDKSCIGSATILFEPELSPSYAHVPPKLRGYVGLATVMADPVV